MSISAKANLLPNASTEIHAPKLKPIGLENKLSEVLGYLKGKEYSDIWIVGPAGIGKTRLLEELRSRLLKERNFTTVIMLQATKVGDIRPMQKKIAEQIMIYGESFNKLNPICRAFQLKTALSKGSSVIIMDDVSEVLDLDGIGIPYLREKCKIVFATRLEDVSYRRINERPRKMVHMGYLSTEKSMELFNAARGNKDTEYQEIVRRIVGKCGCLPLAVVTVGRAAASGSNLEKIEKELSRSPQEINGMKEIVFTTLKSSLDIIDDEDTRSCFLFCALLRDIKDVNKRDLSSLFCAWLRDIKDAEESELESNVEGIINNLLGVCLLVQGRDENHLSMHGMVHAMARWLAAGVEDHDCQIIFHTEGGNYNTETFIERMKKVKWASFNDIDMEKMSPIRLHCPDLRCLFMGLYDGREEAHSRSLCHYQLIEGEHSNNLNCKRYHLSDAFFQKMSNLSVVDLTGQPILHLPNSLCYLKLLGHLNLSWTFIENIPLEFDGLVQLRYLDLNHTPFLLSIPNKTFVGLSRLRTLKIFSSSYARINEKGQLSLEDLETLKDLKELEVTLQDCSIIIDLKNYSKQSWRITSIQLAFVDGLHLGSQLKNLQSSEKLHTISIKSCNIEDEKGKLVIQGLNLETLILQDIIGMKEIIIHSSNQIRKLHISQCSELEGVTGLCQLNNLQILEIEECEEMVELVKHPHQQGDSISKHDHKRWLSRLKSLRLAYLPGLTRISHCSLPFDSLESIFINQCPELKELPVDASTESERKIEICCEVNWWEGLDKNVEHKFLPPMFFPRDDDNEQMKASINTASELRAEMTEWNEDEKNVENKKEDKSGKRVNKSVHADRVSEVMDYLMKGENSVIAIAGAAGVGKTTLLAEVMIAAVGHGQFANVIFLQAGDIENQLVAQVAGPEWRDALKQTRNLYLVDEVPRLNYYLDEIKANYNMVITTRHKSVSLERAVGKVVEMKYLDEESSWQLFLEAAGENEAILEDTEIREVAREMVESCGGLPLALSALGAEARHRVSRIDWDSAGQVIDDSVCDVILGKLNDTEKQCLLFWALFREGLLVNRDPLIGYWIGEGLLSYPEGENIIGELMNNFLLEEVGEELLTVQSVIHSAICSLAKRQKIHTVIDDGGAKVSCIMNGIAMAHRASVKASRIPNYMSYCRPDCKRLKTLLIESPTSYSDSPGKFPSNDTIKFYAVQESSLRYQQEIIHDYFFNGMPNLAVLDMTGIPIVHLPKSVWGLKQLRYLNLSWTLIEELPIDVAKLSELQILDLSFTKSLTSIPRQAFVGIKKKLALKLYCSGYRRFGDIGQIAWHDLSAFAEIDLPHPIMKDFKKTSLSAFSCNFQIKRLSLEDIKWLDNRQLSLILRDLSGMWALSIKGCSRLKGILTINHMHMKILVLCDIPLSMMLLLENSIPCLREFYIYQCAHFKDFGCLSMMPKLRVLGIYKCPKITGLLRQQTGHGYRSAHKRCLPRLEYMTLESLPSLASISDCALALDSLVAVRVKECPKLKRIPLVRGTKRNSITVHCTREWWGNLEWEADDIKSAFTPQYDTDNTDTRWPHQDTMPEPSVKVEPDPHPTWFTALEPVAGQPGSPSIYPCLPPVYTDDNDLHLSSCKLQ